MIALLFLAGCSAMPGEKLSSVAAQPTITPVSDQATISTQAQPDVTVSHLKAKPFTPGKADPEYRVGEGDV